MNYLACLSMILSIGYGATNTPQDDDLKLRMNLSAARSVAATTPVWGTLELISSGSSDEVVSQIHGDLAILMERPEFVLERMDTGAEVPQLSREPLATKVPVCFGRRVDAVPLTGSGTFRKRYLLNEFYGILPPGRYKLAARFYLTVPEHLIRYIPGREAPEKGVISSSAVPMVIWELPEQRVTFHVEEPRKDYAKTLLDRLQKLAKQDRLQYISLDEWISLSLVNTEPAWNFIFEHFQRVPKEARDMAAIFLLNYGTREQAISRASRLLSSSSPWAQRIGLDVIEQHGHPEHARLLRQSLYSSSTNRLRQETYFALSRMLGKPTDPSLGTRRFTEEDARTALGWLDELPRQSQESLPDTHQRLESWSFEVQATTQPTSQAENE